MSRDPEPVERVRAARANANSHITALQEHRAGVVDRLRAVHPAILIGASVAAGFLIAMVLRAPPARRAARAVKTFAPMAAILGYVQSQIWSNAAKAARSWWAARAHREEAAAQAAANDEAAAGAGHAA